MFAVNCNTGIVWPKKGCRANLDFVVSWLHKNPNVNVSSTKNWPVNHWRINLHIKPVNSIIIEDYEIIDKELYERKTSEKT